MTPLKRTRRPSAHAPALLTVDIGNSETTLGVFQDEALVLSYRVLSRPRTPDETFLLLRQMLAPESLDLANLPSVLCSVVPNLTDDFARAVARVTGRAPVLVGPGSVPDLVIRYDDPSAVGPDRLANAVAVRELYGTPAIVVDVGTATTFDVVGEDGDYLGGAIAPGLALSAEALFARAARLGKVELKRPAHVIGKTTEESLQSGIVLGYAGLVDSLVTRILVELGGEAHVVATGGLARLLEGEATTLETFDEGLTLKGLRLIHEQLAQAPAPTSRREHASAAPARPAPPAAAPAADSAAAAESGRRRRGRRGGKRGGRGRR
jgi:type III pantothenate kinase